MLWGAVICNSEYKEFQSIQRIETYFSRLENKNKNKMCNCLLFTDKDEDRGREESLKSTISTIETNGNMQKKKIIILK